MQRSGIIFFVSLILASCGCPKPVISSQKEKEITDVKRYSILRDTVFLTKKTKVALEIPAVCEPFKPLEKKNDNVTVKVEYRDRKIYVQAECDTIELLAKLKHNYTDSIKTITKEVTKVQRVRYTPKFVKMLAWLGLLVIVGGIFFGVRKIV